MFTTIDYLTDGTRIYKQHPSLAAAEDYALDVLYPCVTDIRDPAGEVVREFGVHAIVIRPIED